MSGSRARAQEAWGEAERISEAAGKPYANRLGVRRFAEAENVGITLTVWQRWCARKRFDLETGRPLGL